MEGLRNGSTSNNTFTRLGIVEYCAKHNYVYPHRNT